MAELINGKKVSEEILEEVRDEIAGKGLKPRLDAVLVGSDPASELYVSFKEKACKKVGIESHVYRLPETTSEEELLKLVEELNNKEEVDAILVQFPLPNGISQEKVVCATSPEKDADGLHPLNLGKLLRGDETGLLPATPHGVMVLLERSGVKAAGKNAVVIGRSTLVGKPAAAMLLNRNATVTVCHSKTKNLAEQAKNADILVAAVGKAKLVTGNMVKQGAVVIDVGTNKVEGKLFGDVDFEAVKEKASKITPVPGGVGPMTVAMLMKNVVKAHKMRRQIK